MVVRLARLTDAGDSTKATTDPAIKNLLVRNGKYVYAGMSEAYAVQPERAPGLRTTGTNDLEVRSLDEGIVLSRADTCDDAPAILLQDARCDLWWSGGNEGGDHIFHAVSEDGYLWQGDAVALAPSALAQDKSARDAVHASNPTVLFLRDTYHMYYTGTAMGTIDNEIFLATSPDAATWVKYSADGTPAFPTPVVANARPDGTYGLGHPSALVKDGSVYLYFTDRTRGAGGLWLAVSQDGIHFQTPRQVAKDIENADVKYCAELGVFFLVHGEVNDDKLYWNVSSDGLAWLPHDRARTIATGPPETVHHSPAIMGDGLGRMAVQTRVFYVGGIAGGAALQPETWEIESTWIELRRRT